MLNDIMSRRLNRAVKPNFGPMATNFMQYCHTVILGRGFSMHASFRLIADTLLRGALIGADSSETRRILKVA